MTDLNSACSHVVSPLELLPLGPFFSLSPEKLVPTFLQMVDPQNVAQGGLALPGGKRMLKLSPACCAQTFPALHFHQPAEVERRDVAHEVLGTSPQGQKTANPAQFEAGAGALTSGHPFLQAKQLHLGFRESN